MTRTSRAVLATPVALLLVTGCKESPGNKPAATPPAAAEAPAAAAPVKPDAPKLSPAMLSMFKAKQAAAVEPEALVNLGRQLYFDERLSKNHDVSCNSCHKLDAYGVDGEQFSSGHKGQKGGRNSPTVYDAADHVAQFWDGRAKDLAEQAKGPVLNPVEMAMPDEKRVVATLASMPEYVAQFKAAFPDEKEPVSFENMAKAIAAFERGLVTRSRFDKFVDGDTSALNEQEQRGFALFTGGGCIACHAGPNLGGAMFQTLGLVKPWPDLKDNGRFDATKNDADKGSFKVPGLRNIAKTGPYFHDGSVADLKKAVALMGEYQLGRTFTDAELDDMVAFLESLTGELPTAHIAKPKLPASTAKTPKPDPS